MKKLALTVAIVLGMTCMGMAQGGLFQKGASNDANEPLREGGNGPAISLPTEHGSSSDFDAPVGSGIAVLTVLSAAYAFSKKRKD
jgi:hypothetical protein